LRWAASEENDCVSFRSISHTGVLNVSAVRKPDGRVKDEDFSEFIGEPNHNCSAAEPIHAERYIGFTRKCAHNGVFLAEWWLAHGSVLVFITYAKTTETESTELDEVRRIVESLRIENT
jgi:hypothetical protein